MSDSLQLHGLWHARLPHRSLFPRVSSNYETYCVEPSKTVGELSTMVGSSDKMWSIGEGNDKPFQNSCLENPMNSMKRQKDMTLKDELTRSVGAIRYWRRAEK